MCLSENAGENSQKSVVYHNVFHSKILSEEFVRCFTHVQTHFHRQNRRCPNQKTGHSRHGLLGPLGSWPGRLTAPHELCVAQRFRELASLDHGRPAERMQGKLGPKEVRTEIDWVYWVDLSSTPVAVPAMNFMRRHVSGLVEDRHLHPGLSRIASAW